MFVDHAPAMGGAEHSLLLLLKHLDRTRFQPLLACNPGPLAEAARACGVAVYQVPMPRLRREWAAPWRLAGGVRALACLIRRERVDLVQCNVMRASFYAALAAQITGRPLVWHVRDILAPGAYVRWMARRSALVIAVSRAAARPLPKDALVEVVSNGVDVAAYARQPEAGRSLRRAWGVPETCPLVGLVGRLEPWKGQADFMRAMALVSRFYPTARYALVGGTIFGGGDAYRNELEILARELGLSECLVMAGQREDLPAVYSALDVLVHCSVEPEPFGRVMIEGMAAGLPLVAYDTGGASEIVLPGETGLLVPPRDTQALAKGVMALLADPAHARQLGKAGHRRAQQVYDVRALTRQIEVLLAAAACWQSLPHDEGGGASRAHRD